MRRLLGGVLITVIAACSSAAPSSSTPPTVEPPQTIRPSPSLTATVPPTPSPTPAPKPSAQPTPTPTPAAAGLTFTRASTIDDAELHDVTAFDGVFVAGGCLLDSGHRRCTEALLVHSVDGRQWTVADVPGGEDHQILEIADTPLGLLALGADLVDQPPRTRAVWRSDDGLKWESFEMPAPPPIVFEQAAAINDRTVLIGSDTTYDLTVQTEVWVEDGGSWTSGTTPMGGKIPSQAGFVVIGDDCRSDVCEDGLPLRVYRSPDALTWDRADEPPFADSGVGPLGTWNGQAVFVSGSYDEPAIDATVWIDLPEAWHGAQLDRSAGFVTQVVLDADGRLLILGRRDSDGAMRAWWSDDGATWTRESVSGADGYVVAAAGADPIVLIVDYESIWTSGQ